MGWLTSESLLVLVLVTRSPLEDFRHCAGGDLGRWTCDAHVGYEKQGSFSLVFNYSQSWLAVNFELAVQNGITELEVHS